MGMAGITSRIYKCSVLEDKQYVAKVNWNLEGKNKKNVCI